MNKNSNEHADSLIDNTVMSSVMEPYLPYSGRHGQAVRPGSDRPLRTTSRESVLSGTASINMLLSPLDSHRSTKNVSDLQQESKLIYQLESLTQKLAERDRRNMEMDTETQLLTLELA